MLRRPKTCNLDNRVITEIKDEDDKSSKIDSQKLETTPSETQVISVLFDLSNQECYNLPFEKVLEKDPVISKKPCLLYIIIDTKETMERFFTAFKFNPLIQSECCEWSFKEKDYMMDFENCFFIAMSDCSYFEDIENPIQIKMIVYGDILIVISFEKVHFVEQVFKKELKYKNFPKVLESDEELCLITGNHDLENSKIRNDRKVSLNECTYIEAILHLILDTMISRYEKILFALLVECRTCLCYSTEISYKERVEYLVRVCVSEKSLIYFNQLIKPKQAIMKSLMAYTRVRYKLRPYMECLFGRIKKMSSLTVTGTSLLEKAKSLFSICADDKLTSSSFSLGKLMQFFSGVTTLFLPPFLIAGLWGTNVKIPGTEENNLNTFGLFCSLTLIYFVIGAIYFRKIEWL